MQDVKKVYNKTKLKIARVEEPPTYNSDYLEFSYIDE
jgi:nitrate reductase assembly molybdenum cofactor insertion protein NarJ